LADFRQTFVTGASWDTDDLITFLGQKVKVQDYTVAAEAHSTRRYRRVQLFLVYFYFLFVRSFCFIVILPYYGEIKMITGDVINKIIFVVDII